MLETPHVVVGAAIATKIPNPYVSIPLAFASHFVLEKVPHWNPHLNTELGKYGKVTRKSRVIVTIDATLALLFGITIASRALPDTLHFLTIISACLFSILPDLVEAPYFFLGYRSERIKKWIGFQKSLQVDWDFLPGTLTQIITFVAALWWII
ncbi:MAG: hypothetical protein PVJ52_00150 [Candidatus Woesebacteria bacterium]